MKNLRIVQRPSLSNKTIPRWDVQERILFIFWLTIDYFFTLEAAQKEIERQQGINNQAKVERKIWYYD